MKERFSLEVYLRRKFRVRRVLILVAHVVDPVRNAVFEICSKMSVEIVSLHRSIGV